MTLWHKFFRAVIKVVTFPLQVIKVLLTLAVLPLVLLMALIIEKNPILKSRLREKVRPIDNIY